MSDEDFDIQIKNIEQEAQTLMGLFEKSNEEERAALRNRLDLETSLLTYEDDKLIMNELKRQNFIYKQHLRNIYKNGFSVRSAYKNSAKFETTNQMNLNPVDIVMKSAIIIGYQDLIKDYYQNPTLEYEREYPEFTSYHKFLTLEEIHSMGFNKDKLMKAVEDKRQLEDVFRSIYRVGFISRKELKQIFTKEFKERGIGLSPKATQIELCTIYEVEKKDKYINGKKEAGYILGPIKFNFKL